MSQSGKPGDADYEATVDISGNAVVRVWHDYPAGSPSPTAQRVWQIVADFGGTKKIFPSVLSVSLSFPDASETLLNTVRHMTFAPPDQGAPMSAMNPLPQGIEQLVELDEQARRLAYTSVLGMPVKKLPVRHGGQW
ncbi:MAG: hypothetical protein JWM82_898 [Myxococcales bacterium]|nr:hypothetical protein [Myxococcales bacterium]